MKNYRAQTPKKLALTENFAKFQENEHTPVHLITLDTMVTNATITNVNAIIFTEYI